MKALAVFGWDHPDLERRQTPVGKPCLCCDEPIKADDPGFITPFLGTRTDPPEAVFHRACFYRMLGFAFVEECDE